MNKIINRTEYKAITDENSGIQNKFIRGMFQYGERNEVAFCALLHEHNSKKTIWLSFLTGEWPQTGQADCAVTCVIHRTGTDQVFTIKDGEESPFSSDDLLGCFKVKRNQVLAVQGAEDWFVETYISLFDTDQEIGSFLD